MRPTIPATLALAFAALLFAPGRAAAEEDGVRELLHRILERVERLEQRVQRMEGRAAPRPDRPFVRGAPRAEPAPAAAPDLYRLLAAAREGDPEARRQLERIRNAIDETLGRGEHGGDGHAGHRDRDRALRLERERAEHEHRDRERRAEKEREEQERRARAERAEADAARAHAMNRLRELEKKRAAIEAELARARAETERMLADIEAKLQAIRESDR